MLKVDVRQEKKQKTTEKIHRCSGGGHGEGCVTEEDAG